MPDILIRKVPAATKAMLRRRAEPRGKSLEADLRDALERLAHEETGAPDDAEPFGTWLVSISRPGVDLDDLINEIRSATVRHAPLD